MNAYLTHALTRVILVGLLVLFSACVNAAPSLFWKAESPTANTIYLFGTIHTDDNRVTAFSPAVIHAIKSSDVFMMETLPPRDASILMMPTGNLREMLTDEELEKFYALAEFHVMHRDVAVRMKPWLLAAIFDVPRPNTPFAQDNLLMAQAEDFGKHVIGIETAEEHFGIMDNISLPEQLNLLRAVLNRSVADKERDYERLMQAYLKADMHKLSALNAEITGSSMPAEVWSRMRVKLLDERNVLMAQRMLAAAKTQKLFVAVGASHLAGKDGLLHSLEQAGFKLSPVR